MGGSLVIRGNEVKLPDFPEKKWSRSAGGYSRSYCKNDQVPGRTMGRTGYLATGATLASLFPHVS